MLTKTIPDLRLFWTAHDSLDLASGSIDVLGFQAGYIALADKFLPGFTTVTTSPRYVSMLCAAIAKAETEVPGLEDAAVRVRQKRLALVMSYERAWALACALVATGSTIGERAVDGLRGVRYVRRRLSELSERDKSIRTSSFNLLANQVRYGGIGTYSTMLEDCHLATMRSVTLRPLGMQLAESFPGPGGGLPVWDEDRPLPLDALFKWGEKCHLGKLAPQEGGCLKTALRGGEEGGWDDDVRWTTLRLLAAFGADEVEEQALLERLHNVIRDGEAARLNENEPVLSQCLPQIEAALVLIRPYERLYQAVQFLFDAVRAAATDEPEVRLSSPAVTQSCISAHDGARSAASGFLKALERARTIHPQTAEDLCRTFVETGVLVFAEAVRGALNVADLLVLVLDRHRAVQQGKFDRGEPKVPWIRWDPASGTARLTAQRHQLPRSDRYESWEQVPRHPYRTYGALRFVKACRIR